MLAGKLLCLLPLGSVALRVGLASSLAGAAAAAQAARLGQIVARSIDARSPHALLGAAAGLLFGLSYAAAFQAVRPEVYALSALCVLTAAVELARFDESGDRRRLYLAALAVGLGLANHHLLALALAGPGLIFAALRKPRRPVATGVARVGLAGTLGLSLYAYLPLRALRHPLIDWGAPTSLSRFYWVVSASAFHKALARGHAEAADALGVLPALVTQLHLAGALLALAGLYLLLRTPPTRRLGLFLVLGVVLGAAAPALVGFDPANPDAYGYLAPAVALAAAAACALPAVLLARLAERRRTATSLATLPLIGALAWGACQWPLVTLSNFHDTGALVGGWLSTAPPRAPVVTSYFQTIFAAWYLRAVEGRRPDDNVIHRHFLSYPGYRDELLRANPELAPLLGEHDVNPAALETGALVEYDSELPDALVARSRVVAGDPVSRETQTRRFSAWMALLDAHRACRLGPAPAPIKATLAHAPLAHRRCRRSSHLGLPPACSAARCLP